MARLHRDWEPSQDGGDSTCRLARLGTDGRSEQHWLEHGFSYEVETDMKEVDTVTQMWREKYEYFGDTHHFKTHFIQDCHGSKALHEWAAAGGATCVIWLRDQYKARVGLAGATVEEGPSQDVRCRQRMLCRLQRIYVVPPSRGKGVGVTLLSSLVCAVQLMRLRGGLGMCTHFGLGFGLRAQQQTRSLWVRLGWPVSQPHEVCLPDHEVEVQALLSQLPRQVFANDQDVFPSTRDWSMKLDVSTQLTAITM